MKSVMQSGGSQGAGYARPKHDEERCGILGYLKIG